MSTAVAEKPDFLVSRVRRQRVVQTRPYESDTVSAEVEYIIDPDGTPEDNLARGKAAGIEATDLVYVMLGLPAELDDNGIPREIIQQGFPGSEVIDEATAGVSSSVPAEPPHDPSKLRKRASEMNDIEKAQSRANVQWAKDRYDSHPSEFYDNRNDKKTSSSPDFKHKTSGVAFWLD